MKKQFVAALLTLALGASFGTNALAAEAETETTQEVTCETVALELGEVEIYDFGDVKLHAYNTKDALGDECYIIEGADSLIEIEVPAFTANHEEWNAYAESLGKPMNDLLIDAHPTGESYVEGMNIYATQAAKDAIESGSTYATVTSLIGMDGLADDFIEVTDVVEAGTLELGGVEFNIIDTGDTYEIEIPAMNVIYTHMMGGSCHSIIASLDQLDAMLATVEGYQTNGYDLILTSHCAPEDQSAVAAKIAYLEQTKEIASESADAEEFTAAMKEAFPDYAGESYLEMTAGFLFPAE